MKRFTTITCVIALMALGLWRAWSDSHTIGSFDSYKTAVAGTVQPIQISPQELPIISEKELPSTKDSVVTGNTEASDTIVQKLTYKQSVKPVTSGNRVNKRKAVRQKQAPVVMKEAEAIKVSNDSATYYGKRILDVVEHLDKKISAPCVEIHEEVDSLSNGSHLSARVSKL